jgi:hypothetical protein
MLIGSFKGEPTAQTHIIKQSHNRLPNVRSARQQTNVTSQVSFFELPEAPWSLGCLTPERKLT